MRNPLKRLTGRDQTTAPLRERLARVKDRLAAGRDKAKRFVDVNRMLLSRHDLLLSGPPKPAPPVDRVALIDYATWLYHERAAVCAELYPHLGRKATQFVLAINAADRFFYSDDGRRRPRDLPPVSSRALKVLDAVGIDWRQDANDDTRGILDAGERIDTGARPALPHGWPAPDAALLEALDDLIRIDAAQDAIHEAGDASRDGDTVPGYEDLEAARDDALDRLAKERAESFAGLQAKSRALLARSVVDGGDEPLRSVALSLARDLVGASQSWLDDRPDPIFAVIEESRRLAAVSDASILSDVETPESHAASVAAGHALFDHWRSVVLKTVPRTATGCAALARWAAEFHREQGDPEPVETYALLGLIARSPLL